jgi:hypothetical protein
MTQHMNRPLLALLMLAAMSEAAQGQVPERGTVPVMTSDPSVPPPLPTTDPQLGTAPPAVVQPGTVLQQPVSRATQLLKYTPAGEAPGGVQVTATEPRTVTLSWTAPAGASGYWIHQAGPGQTMYYRGGSLVTETTAMVTGLLPATSYSFKVSAVYPQEAQLAEGLSGPVTATTAAPPAPTGLTASVVGRGQVSLSWDGLPGADGFRLFRNGELLSDIKPITLTLGGPEILRTTFADSVHPGAYRYQLQAVYRSGAPGPAAEAVSAPAPTPPVGVTFNAFVYCQTQESP